MKQNPLYLLRLIQDRLLEESSTRRDEEPSKVLKICYHSIPTRIFSSILKKSRAPSWQKWGRAVAPTNPPWPCHWVYCKFADKLNFYCTFADKPHVWGCGTPSTRSYSYAPSGDLKRRRDNFTMIPNLCEEDL